MGQYYRICYSTNDKDIVITDRRIASDSYVGAKLMEFCWLDDNTSNSILTILSKSPARFIVVGDYANSDEWYENLDCSSLECPSYDDVWGDNVNVTHLPPIDKNPAIDGKYIVNHSKQTYIDIDDYLKRSTKKYSWSNYPLTINPVILLTAVGNGLGSGDYDYHDPVNVDHVGNWAWDLLELTEIVPSGYTKYNIEFYENYKY